MPSALQPSLFDLPNAPALPFSQAVTDAVATLAGDAGTLERGAIYTRQEVVEFMLDLIGYVPTAPLHQKQALEPSFGGGDFLLPMTSRLLKAWRAHKGDEGSAESSVIDVLGNALCAVELHRDSFEKTRDDVIQLLCEDGLSEFTSTALADRWLMQGDFLLQAPNRRFDYVVGNPPYVRQEMIPVPLLAEYRSRYQTMYDRADLYVPFIEASLGLLADDGKLGFICADRWMKNRYGRPLRAFVAQDYHLEAYVDMVDTDAFHTEVSAYPAITVISKPHKRSKTAVTRIAHRPDIETNSLARLAKAMNGLVSDEDNVTSVSGIVNGSEPWLLESSDQIALLRRIEQDFPRLEETGCKVGIGVATGADKAFIADFEALDVEPDRKLPLVAPRDIGSGEVKWRGQGVINPFADDGALVDLGDYPKLASYLHHHKEKIAGRHCAKKTPSNWYRTIDRIWPELTHTPKLLIPDIKGEAHIVYEPGKLYPHHNLYYVVAKEWDFARAASGAAFPHRPALCRDLLNENAWRLSALSGAISAAHLHSALEGRFRGIARYLDGCSHPPRSGRLQSGCLPLIQPHCQRTRCYRRQRQHKRRKQWRLIWPIMKRKRAKP